MKNPTRILATSIVVLLAAQSAKADFFDLNSTTSGFGVADAGSYDWWASNVWAGTPNDTGTAATATWVNGTRQAYFVGAGTGTTYTVRLGSDGTTATTLQNFALNVNSALSGQLAGSAGNVTIGNVGDTGVLSLSGANSIGSYGGTLTVNNPINLGASQNTNFRGGTVVLNGSISGTGTSGVNLGAGAFGLTSGTLTLAGSNSFTGGTSVASGYTLTLQHANALGAAGGTNTVASGGRLVISSGVSIAGESVTINGNGGADFLGALRAGSGGGTWSGQVTLGDAAARIGALAGQTLTITGSIVNGAATGFTVSGESGTGVVALNPTAPNTYTGTTSILRGILRIGKTDALPTGTTLDVDSAGGTPEAAALDLASFSQTVAVLQDTATTSITGKITNSVASTISTLTVNQASNSTFDGVIENGSGSVVLTKTGVGNLTLNGANTFTGGTNIQNGKIVITGGNDRLAAGGSVTIGSVTNSGALVLGDATTARNQTLAGLTTTGLGGSVVGANATTDAVLTLNIASGTNTYVGTLGGAGTNENKLALTKSGAGTLKLSGANTYSGTTTLTQGTLQIGVEPVGTITSSAIGTGTLTFNGGTLSSDGATARTIGNAVTFSGNAGLGDASNNGNLTFTNNMDLGAATRTITVNSAVQLNGSFTNSAAASGVIKAGAGTLTINAANTSFGNTNGFAITGGTVVAANTAAMGNAGQIVTLSSGSSFGTLDLATNTSANAYVLNFGSVAGAGGNVLVNRATPGDGATITHTMGTATLGNAKVNVLAGGNITSGTPTLEFTGMNLTAGAPGDGATTLNPTTARILISGAITRTGGSSNSLVLDGTNANNLISGAISGPQTLTKSNSSIWELSNANTFTGNTKVTGGTLKLTNNLAIQSSAFDTSGAGTLDITTINTPSIGGLIGDASTGNDLVLPSNVTNLTLNVGTGITYTYVKNISGGAAGLTLTKTGSSTQVLGGTNSYSGLTSVGTLGELQITSAGAIGGTDVTVATGGQLTLNGGVTVTGKTLTTSGSGRTGNGTPGAFVGGLQSVSGTNEWAGSVILGADFSRVGARSGATLVVSGVIDDGINTFTAVFRNQTAATNGAGNASTITEISGINTYGGNTQFISGVTRLAGGNNRLPIATVLQFGSAGANAKFDMNGRSQEVAGLSVNNTASDTNRDWNANELTNSSGTLSTLTVNTASDQTFGVTPTNFVGNGNYTGIITGNIALEKKGAAKLTLSGTNTYTGTTTVSAGTLLVSGSISGSAVTVNNTGTLAGTGTTGAVTANSGATISPGLSPGILSTGALTMGAGSTLSIEINGLNLGTDYDQLSVTGGVDITGATLSLSGSFNAGATNDLFTILLNDGSDGITGTFAGLTEGSSFFALSGQAFNISYVGGDGNDIVLIAVPEPGSAALLLGGLALLGARRRRK